MSQSCDRGGAVAMINGRIPCSALPFVSYSTVTQSDIQ